MLSEESAPAALEKPEVMAKAREQLLKHEEPPAIIRRIQESAAIPDACKPRLVEALRRPANAKYRRLVTAYFNTIARYKR